VIARVAVVASGGQRARHAASIDRRRVEPQRVTSPASSPRTPAGVAPLLRLAAHGSHRCADLRGARRPGGRTPRSPAVISPSAGPCWLWPIAGDRVAPRSSRPARSSHEPSRLKRAARRVPRLCPARLRRSG
jgi:transcription elongation factor